MEIGSLVVLHQRKSPGNRTAFPELEGFNLDSCQRRLWVGARDELAGRVEAAKDLELFRGETAYGFLLRVATGLESAVVAETDIFGQLKDAWCAFEGTGLPQAARMHTLFRNLFEDAKDIRAQYLQNVGGASYGSLARMLLKPVSTDRILLLGAGKLAQSVAPYLTDAELLIWNRTPEKAQALAAKLGARAHTLLDEAVGWQQATKVVICVPLSPEQDAPRLRWRGEKIETILHMGALRGQAEASWERLSGYLCLNDVFDLKQSQSNVRQTQISRAARACEERSLLRRLGRSLSIAHGWEDLAMFAL